jgi:hypothetical protein
VRRRSISRRRSPGAEPTRRRDGGECDERRQPGAAAAEQRDGQRQRQGGEQADHHLPAAGEPLDLGAPDARAGDVHRGGSVPVGRGIIT